jgi:flagellar hook-basal body complex protein FliE
MNMSNIEINQILQQIRSMAAMADGIQSSTPAGTEAAGLDFGRILKDSVNEVNQVQQKAQTMATAFESGDPTANLSEVMIAIQKANVSFQAMTQVRNNLVSAYKEIMNMQV